MLGQENRGFINEGGKRIIFELLQEAEIKQTISDFQQHVTPDVSKNARKIIKILDSQ